MLDAERPYEIDGIHVLVGYGLGFQIHTVPVLAVVLDNATEAKTLCEDLVVAPIYNFTRHGKIEGHPSMRSKISGSLTVHRHGIMICLPQRKPPSPLHRTPPRHTITHYIRPAPAHRDLNIESPPKVHLIPYRLPPSTCHPWRFTSTTAIPPTAGPHPRHPPPCTST